MCAEKTPNTVNTRRKTSQHEKADKSDKQPTITESMGGAKGSQGGRDKDSETLKELIKQIDQKWSNNWAELTKKIDTNNGKIVNIEKKFDTMFEQLSIKITTVKGDLQQNLKDVKERVNEVENSVSFHANQRDLKDEQRKVLDKMVDRQRQDFESLVKKQENVLKNMENKIASEANILNKKIKELEIKNLRLEKQDRNYSLLLYGIPQEDNENVYNKVKKHLVQNMSMDDKKVEEMVMQNAHRIPQFGERRRPPPIIVKFACFTDREMVLEHRKYLPKGTRVMTDLPVIMKKERGRLESLAYELRNPSNADEKVQTRVKEMDLTLVLETRKNSSENWTPYKLVKFDT